MLSHKQQFYERQEHILATAEEMLLDSVVGDLTLEELAVSVDIAKGTLYKHFVSKNELFLHILIRHEKTLYTENLIDDSPSAVLVRMLLQSLIRPRRAMLFNQLEERLADSSIGLNRLFDELYAIRKNRMDRLLGVAKVYLDMQGSTLSTRDYLSSIWAIGQGGASLLNSTFYQRYLGRRDTLMVSLIHQMLDLPKLYPATTRPSEAPIVADKPKDEFSPFGKMTPSAL